MNTSRALLATAIAALIAGSAVANDNDQYGDKDQSAKAGASFDALDANRDGRISQAEASADSTISFTTADANGDGYLDAREFKKALMTGQPDPSVPQEQSSPPPSDTGTARQ